MYDIVDQYEDISQLTNNYQAYFDRLTSPYSYFLQYLYLPRLNIWKNPFSQKIDITLIGENFLNNDPYSDLSLIAEWSNYFRDVWSNTQFNEINDIRIDDIQERQWDFFVIPVTLSFTSPDKRSFLMLVEKLSMTSNKENISLINEFFYHLWRVSSDRHRDALLQNDYVQTLDPNLDEEIKVNMAIGYALDQWIHHDADIFLTSQDITEAVSLSTRCNSSDIQVCYFLFRDKFRTLPYLAYNVARPGIDNIQWLKGFLEILPPVIEIKQFTFERARDARGVLTAQTAYEWQITIDIYGKNISDQEQDEIARELGYTCFGEDQALSVDVIAQRIQNTLVRLSQIDSIDSDRSKELVEMQNIIESIIQQYPRLNKYEQTIKLFEVFRMAYDGNVCE